LKAAGVRFEQQAYTQMLLDSLAAQTGLDIQQMVEETNVIIMEAAARAQEREQGGV
jgi:hypothetical protein